MKSHVKDIADRELIEILVGQGYGDVIAALMHQEAYTKKGRLNKSALCRVLGWKAVDVQNALDAMKELLDPTTVTRY